MNGTSLDGIDIALCAITQDSIQTLHTKEYPFDRVLKSELLALITEQTTLKEVGKLDQKLSSLYVHTLKRFLQDFAINRTSVRAIGLHGQTVWHEPKAPHPFSMQLGSGAVVAKQIGIDVVCDFRSGDIALGGEGAPLTPAFHQELFGTLKNNVGILNLGGIANLTLIGNHCMGYDIGPANILMDYWITKNRELPFDQGGLWAKSGTVHPTLLERLLSDPYLTQKPPKSTGREHFNGAWLEHQLKGLSIKPVDVQATLLAFTAHIIQQEVRMHSIKKLLVCGGGAHNRTLLEQLSSQLDTQKTDAYGVSADFMESIAFAWLAYKRIRQEPIDLKEVTGASKNTVLGALYAHH
jgi:anhydro-N-acetylmuramic acid kinase